MRLPQLTILNGASIFGRTIPPLFAPKYGVFVLMSIFSSCTGIIIMSMLAVKDLAGTAVFAVFVGFFMGACMR